MLYFYIHSLKILIENNSEQLEVILTLLMKVIQMKRKTTRLISKTFFFIFNTNFFKKSFPLVATNRTICHLTKLLPEQEKQYYTAKA